MKQSKYSRRNSTARAVAEAMESRTMLSVSYSAFGDFSLTSNPNGAWSYGQRTTEASSFTPYTFSGNFDLGPVVQGWFSGTGSLPAVLINTTSAAAEGLTYTLPPGVIDMHPGSDGTYSDVRFTAPTAGPFSLDFNFFGIDRGGTTTDVHVLRNNVSIADGNINGYQDAFGQTLNVSDVAAGDTFDFIVGYGTNGNYFSDSTALTAVITPGGGPTAKSIGGLDPSFGNSGLASHNVGFTRTNGVAVDGTQSVLIGPIGTSPDQTFGVTRYNGDGSLDIAFGTGGVSATRFGATDDVPSAVSVLGNGDILVAGTAFTAGVGSAFAVAEFNPDGSPNMAFGNGGEMLVSFSGVAGASSNDVLHAMAVAADGTIYLGGSSDAAGAGHTDFGVAALSSGGALLASFGAGGIVTTDISGDDDVINSLAVQNNGDVVAAGAATVDGVSEIALARYDADAALDKKFGDKGVVTDAVGSVYDAAASVAIQPKGQIVVGGFTATGSGTSLTSDFVLQRYTAAGKPDRSFGSGGTVDTSFGQPAAVTQVLVQSNGSIVASGKTSTTLGGTLDVATARYTPRGVLDTSFAGTGKVIIDLGAGIVPQVASTLGAEFDAFTNSLQGVVAVTQGGEILDAGNSGENTVEAELITAGVDLVASLLSTLPASVLAGVKDSIRLSITETGTTAASGAVTVDISFATDAGGYGASTPVGSGLHINLKQGQAKPFKIKFVYPTGLSSGDYFLIATVSNGAGVPDDLNADNNAAVSAAAVAIAPAFVMLTGSNLSASPVLAGKTATFTLTVANAGNVKAAGKTEVDFYVSIDDTVAGGTLLGVAPLGVSLAAGKSKVYRLKVAVPATVAAGTFDLLGVIDPAQNVSSDDTTRAIVVDAVPVVVS